MVGVACGSPYIVPMFKIPHGNIPIWCEKASPTMVMLGQHSYIDNQMQVSGSHNKCVQWQALLVVLQNNPLINPYGSPIGEVGKDTGGN